MTLDSKTDFDGRQEMQARSRDELEQFQFAALQRLLTDVLPENSFYREKFAGLDTASIHNRADLAQLSLTTKAELLGDGSSPYAANLTFERSQYVRFHRTSGTQGRPMTVLDTAEDWTGWTNAWQYVLDAAQVDQTDTALMAFSFGPFIGFWSAFDAAVERGLTVVPTGAMTTVARLDLVFSSAATVVFCTPSYALHMAEVAAERAIDLRTSGVKKIIVAGEPGGSIPATRARIELAWDAQVIDHAGASEVGPWGFADTTREGLFVNEAYFLPELISIEDQSLIPLDTFKQTNNGSGDGELLAELVLTSLVRYGCPVIRYRTGDLVRPVLQRRCWPKQFSVFAGRCAGAHRRYDNHPRRECFSDFSRGDFKRDS